MTTLQHQYTNIVVPELQKRFKVGSILAVPRMLKVTVNVGTGKSMKDPQVIQTVEETLVRITGQKPVKTRAKKSIASFKVREGAVVGMMVTLRKKRMYDFVEKLISCALPRVRDFRGLDLSSVDGQGSLSIGFREHLVFPEIRSDEVERTHGLQVTITTNARNRERGLALFSLLGFPFKKHDIKKK